MFRTRKSHAMSVPKIDDRAVSELLGWLLRMRRRERDRIQDPIQRPTYCANQNQPAPVASDPLSEFHFPSSSSRIRSDNLRSNASVRYPRNNQPKHNPLRNRKKQASFISSPLVLGYGPRLPLFFAWRRRIGRMLLSSTHTKPYGQIPNLANVAILHCGDSILYWSLAPRPVPSL